MNPADPGLDPTKVLNQQSLRRSSGTIWLVMGALFLIASLFSFGVVMAGGSGASMPLAITGGAIAIVVYGAMVLVRLVVGHSYPHRLRCALSLGALAEKSLRLVAWKTRVLTCCRAAQLSS